MAHVIRGLPVHSPLLPCVPASQALVAIAAPRREQRAAGHLLVPAAAGDCRRHAGESASKQAIAVCCCCLCQPASTRTVGNVPSLKAAALRALRLSLLTPFDYSSQVSSLWRATGNRPGLDRVSQRPHPTQTHRALSHHERYRDLHAVVLVLDSIPLLWFLAVLSRCCDWQGS
jgi:hypothetical protein